jgi:hypothetical protein
MDEYRYVRSASLAPLLALSLALSSPAVAAQGQATVSICHRTGSETNPWVFMTIEERRWPAYQAQGAFRASSAVECMPARQQSAAVQQPPAVAQQQPPAQDQQDNVGPEATTAMASATAPEAASVPAQAVQPDVSVLPTAGEPGRPSLTLALVFLVLGGLGFYLRRPGRQRI